MKSWLFDFENFKHDIENGIPVSKDCIYWIQDQRRDYFNKNISQERIKRLESIPWWSWDVDKHWEKMYHESVMMISKTGIEKISDDTFVYSWCKRMKSNHDRLHEFQKILLEFIPGWDWRSDQSLWMTTYHELLYHSTIRTDLIIEKRIRNIRPEKNRRRIKRWVNKQRSNYENDKIAKYKIELLESIPGWNWYISIRQGWMVRYDNVLKIVNETGKMPGRVKNKHTLANWITSQRTLYRRGLLSNKKIELLEKIPGWFWSLHNREKWDEKVDEAMKAHMDQQRSDRSDIMRWCSLQKFLYSKGKLSRLRAKSLEKIPNWSWYDTSKEKRS
jgi:hypothetical protein